MRLLDLPMPIERIICWVSTSAFLSEDDATKGFVIAQALLTAGGSRTSLLTAGGSRTSSLVENFSGNA
jgi:hypothetical protein